MSGQRNFRLSGVLTTGAALLLALTPVVSMCQIAPAQEAEQAPSETIEEIIVYGEKSLLALRQMVHGAEENFLAVFNSLNSDEEFDIHCHKEASTGSHIKRRVCKANYVKELTAEATSRALQTGMGIGMGMGPAMVRIQHKDKLLREEMESLLVERPELLKALSEFSDAKQFYESEHQRRCEGRFLICRRF